MTSCNDTSISNSIMQGLINWKSAGKLDSVVSRAILKPVYRFGIPNSDLQILKSVDFWCELSPPFVVAVLRERCFELFRIQNSRNFPGFCSYTPLERAFSDPALPDSPVAQRYPQKLLDTALLENTNHVLFKRRKRTKKK